MSVPVEELIARYVEPEPNSGCWIWVGHRNSTGYGACLRDRKKVPAHRVIYERYRGPIPAELEADHKCRNRPCVNPDHIEPVTRRENVRRGVSPASRHMAQTHCSRGHEFNATDTYYRGGPKPNRVCKWCRRIHDARRRAKNRAVA